MSGNKFIKFKVNAQSVAICERIKKGNYRPCIETIPSSTVAGFIKDYFAINDVYGIGFFQEGTYEKETFIYAPFDNVLDNAKLPISIEYLRPINGMHDISAEVYILLSDETKQIANIDGFTISIGALRNKGFGECHFIKEEIIEPGVKVGYLKGRLREFEAEKFGIERILRPIYGYLFKPTSEIGGEWVRALFEESIIRGYDFIIGKEYIYEYQ